MARELFARGIHQHAVPRAADVERNDALRARRRRELAGDAHCFGVAADHDLAGRVEVRELHAARASSDSLRDRFAQRAGVEPEDRGHRALRVSGGALHR